MKRILLPFLLLATVGISAHAQVSTQTARRLAPTTFTNLGTPANGEVRFCSDCAATSPCTGSGSGATATRVAGAWNCSTGGGGVNASAQTAASATTALTVDDTWTDVSGATVTLPSAGVYLINFTVVAYGQTSSGSGSLRARLFNTTDAAEVSASLMTVVYATTSGAASSSAKSLIVTVAASKAIKIQGLRGAGPVYTASSIYSDGTTGYSLISYVKLSN